MSIITRPNLGEYDLYNPSDTEDEDFVVIRTNPVTEKVQALQAQNTAECANREFERLVPGLDMVPLTRERTPQDVQNLHQLLDAASAWTLDAGNESAAQPSVYNLAVPTRARTPNPSESPGKRNKPE